MDSSNNTNPGHRRINFYSKSDVNLIIDSLKPSEVRRVNNILKHAVGEGWPEHMDLKERRVIKIAKDLGKRAFDETDELRAQELFSAQQALLDPIEP